MRRWLIILIAVLVLGGGWYVFHTRSDATPATTSSGKAGGRGAKRDGPIPVGVATAKTIDMPVTLTGLGTVVPRNSVIVHSRVDGQLMKLHFEEGQFVKAGQLLAELDARPFQAQLEQAQGQLKRDEALLADAKINLQRFQTLFKQDSIAKQQLDTQASLVKQYQGVIESDRGQVNTAQLQVTYSRVTAPVSGRVGLRQVDPGNIVHAGDANGIVVITQLQPITVLFSLPEDAIAQVFAQGDEKLSAEAFDRGNKVKLASGVLIAVDNQVDPTTGTVKLKAQFENKDNALFPNQFVNLRLRVSVIKDAIVIPSSGLQRGSEGTFVYLVNDKSVAMQAVKASITDGDSVVIESGVKAGDVIVTDGADSLKDGAKIEIAEKDEKKTEPAPIEKKPDEKKSNHRKPKGG